MNAKDIFDKVIDDALHDGTGMFRVTYIDPKETSQVAPLARAPASIVIVVYGMPGPQGSKSFKGTFTGKDGRTHAMLTESSKKVKPWRQDVKAAAEAVRSGADPLDGPLRVSMVFTLPKPASAPKRRQTWPMKTPDVSKLARSTEDALTNAGIWKDDARVVEYALLAKRYPGEGSHALEAPGVWIEIERMDLATGEPL